MIDSETWTLCHHNQMQSDAKAGGAGFESGATRSDVAKQSHHLPVYQKVFDGRKRPIRGLWSRGSRFYARLSVVDPLTGRKNVRRVPLAKAETVAQAQAELRRLMTEREDNSLPVLRRTPKFEEFVAQYLAFYETVNRVIKTSGV